VSRHNNHAKTVTTAGAKPVHTPGATESPLAGLAPLIEPAPPAAPAATTLPPLGAAGLGLALVAAIALGMWQRQTPRRMLRRVEQSIDPAAGAELLADWARRHAPHAGSAWRQALERLRFGPPRPDAATELIRLCQEAEQWRT
jgi:hypothetical protein